MNPLLFLRELATDAVIERLGWVLVHSLWQFALVTLVAAVVVRWLVPGRAAARYAVLVGALATIAACPALTWSLQPAPVVQTRTPVEISHPTLDEAAGNTSSAESDVPVETIATAEPDPPVTETVPASLSDSAVPAPAPPPLTWWAWAETELRPWLAWIVVAWSCGVVVFALRPLVGWHSLWRLRRVGVSPVGEEITAALRRVARQLGLRRAVQVVQSTLVQTPVLIGYFRPAILLPVGLVTGLPLAQLEAILAHELAHVRRHDFLVNLLQTLVETLCFYHPAVWWLSRQIRVEREHCCDDLVVGLLGNRVEYGRALLAVEELRGTTSVLALGMADGALLSRVRRLLGGNAGLTVLRPAERWIVLVLAAVGLCVTLVAVRTGLDVVRDADSPQFSITLPNGTVVELLGVATGEADSQWWSPDGTLLEKTPLPGLLISSGFEPAKECRSFAVRIRGKGNDDALIRPDGARQYQSSGRGDPAGIVERVLTARRPVAKGAGNSARRRRAGRVRTAATDQPDGREACC